jgi:hypothetical protein
MSTNSNEAAAPATMMTPDYTSLMMYSSPTPSSLPLINRSVNIQSSTIFGEAQRKSRDEAVKKALIEEDKRTLIEQANRDGMARNYTQRLRGYATNEDGSINDVIPVKKEIVVLEEDSGRNSVIENRNLARTIYTAKNIFAMNSCQRQRQADDFYDEQKSKGRYKDAVVEYEQLDNDYKAWWEMQARMHDEQQPTIKDRIIQGLKANPKISWEKLEELVGRWCSASTIWRWVTSHAD